MRRARATKILNIHIDLSIRIFSHIFCPFSAEYNTNKQTKKKEQYNARTKKPHKVTQKNNKRISQIGASYHFFRFLFSLRSFHVIVHFPFNVFVFFFQCCGFCLAMSYSRKKEKKSNRRISLSFIDFLCSVSFNHKHFFLCALMFANVLFRDIFLQKFTPTQE